MEGDKEVIAAHTVKNDSDNFFTVHIGWEWDGGGRV